jgi:hypothetical protein
LYSKVMREGLSTGPRAKRSGCGLSGRIFSGPHDCAILVNSLQATEKKPFQKALPECFDRSRVRTDGPKTGRSIIRCQPMVHLRERSIRCRLARSVDVHASQSIVPAHRVGGRAQRLRRNAARGRRGRWLTSPITEAAAVCET